MYCDNCGQENPDGTRFCAACGHVVNAPAAAIASTTEAARRLRSAATTAARSPAAKSSASLFSAVFGNFDVMVTPKIMAVIFWLLVIAQVIGGLMGLVSSIALMDQSGGAGLLMLIATVVLSLIGIVASRIFCEFIILLFKIHQALQDIRTQTARS